MRNLGLVLLIAGVIAFLYCSSQLSGLEGVPEGTSLGDYLRHPAGAFELGRYAGGLFALVGLLLIFFPRGR